MTPAGQLPTSETQGLGTLEIQGKCFGNIPPPPNDYIKRTALESELLTILLQEDRYPIVTLLGSGGIGKTSLALAVLHELVNRERYECIFWFSSRDIDLKPEGPKHVKNSILSEQDLADEYVKLVDKKELNKSNDKLNFFSNELVRSSYGKTLFVLDNFETVVNPAELFKWIDTYVRNPNKVLITSRISKNFKADYPIEVQGMNYEEGIELINKTAENLSILPMISDEIKERIFDEAKGHPYVIKILLGQMAKDKTFSTVDRIMASQEEILVALFRRTFASLSPAAQRVFLTLCSWRSVIPVIALEAVMLRDEIKDRINVDDAIDELKRSSFIDIIHSEKDASSFVIVPLAAQFFGKGELEVSPMKMAILSDKELLLEFGAIQQSDIYNGLKPRIERKFRTVANRVLNDGESLNAHLPTLEYLCRKFPFAWNFLYELYIERGCHKEAEESLREYLKTTLSTEEKRDILDKLASLYRFERDYLAEVSVRIDMCLLPDTSLDEVSEIANIVNNYLYSDEIYPAKLELNDETKQSLIRRLTDIFKEKINRDFTVTATDYSRLAWLYMHLHDMEAAERTVEKGLAKDFSNTHIRKLAAKFDLY